MTEAMSDYLEREMQCEGLLECMHGLKGLDKEVFRVLTEHADPMTVDDVAAAVDRERSTAYRAIQRLVTSGFVQREQRNYEQGGYYHVFRPTDPDRVADDMQRLLNDWYAKMGQLIDEFQRKYDGSAER